MREVPLEKLKPIPKCPSAVLHKSGNPILRPGEALSEAVIELLRDSEVDSVFFPDPGERLDMVRREMTHTPLPLTDLHPGEELTRPVYDNEGHLLLEAGASIPANFAESLERRGMSSIYQRKPEEDVQPKVGRKLRAEIEQILSGVVELAPKKTLEEIKNIEFEAAKPEELNSKALEAKIGRMDKIDVQPAGEPFEDLIQDNRKRGPASAEEKKALSDNVNGNLDAIRALYKQVMEGSRKIDVTAIDQIATDTMAGLIRNRELLMLCGTSANDEEYLVSHALATTVIAINLGATLGYGMVQIKSLAYGAVLADVGMTKIKPSILTKTEKLTPGEHAEIRRHPAFGLDMLQRVSSIPDSVPYIVYQSHERANGSGYPCGKKDIVIHPFAKIVGVADIYTSIISQRPYRQAKLPYEGMEQLVLMCGKRILNADIVRGILCCNSIFPVGSFVRLNDGRGARVVVANKDDYMRPVIALLTDAENKVLPEPERLDLTEQPDLSVSQAIGVSDLPVEDDLMLGF